MPITRGKERSRPWRDIVLEAERLASLGTREITLLGQTKDAVARGDSFADLLAQLTTLTADNKPAQDMLLKAS